MGLAEDITEARKDDPGDEMNLDDNESESHYSADDGRMAPIRSLQPLREGFTMLGDEIIGYLPLRRQSRYSNGESLLIGCRVFIEVKDTGDSYVASGSEIGGM